MNNTESGNSRKASRRKTVPDGFVRPALGQDNEGHDRITQILHPPFEEHEWVSPSRQYW